MSFQSSDIQFYFSAGGGPNELRTSNLGGDISATQIGSSTMRNFCPDLIRSQIGNIGSPPSSTWAIYFPYFITNKHDTVTVTNLYQWIYKPSSHPSISVALGLDPAGLNQPSQTIANQTTKPTGVSFSTSVSSTPDPNMLIDSLEPDDYYPCWVSLSGQKGIHSIPMITFGIKVKWDPEITEAV